MPIPPNRLRNYLLLAGIVLLAFLLRVYRSGSYGIFFDEKSTLLISRGIVLEGANQKDVFEKKYFTPRDFWKEKTLTDFNEAVTRGDIGNSPAYYAVLRLWEGVFGMTDFAIRLLSVVFSTLTVILLYIFVKKHVQSEIVALVSSGIAAIEPFFVAYSHMARNYSMTFFLTLLATHVFLLIVQRGKSQAYSFGLFAAYSLLIALSVLSHFLAVTVFLCHALYAIFFIRAARSWIGLTIAAGLAFIPILLWFTIGGGQYTFFTLNYQATLYRGFAYTNPYHNGYGLILPATVANVFNRSLPVFGDLVIFTNGLASTLIGYRNLFLSLFGGLGAMGILHGFRYQQSPPFFARVAFPLLLVFGLPFYSVAPFRYLVLSAALPLYYLLVRALLEDFDKGRRSLIVFMLLLSFIPTLFLVVMAFRSGHTYGITQRYSGFSFPYVIVLVALLVRKLTQEHLWISLPLAVILVIQAGFIGQLLSRIYEDSDPKYTHFYKQRQPNPFYTAAMKIKELYMPGDTIIYPSLKRREDSDMDKLGQAYSVIDAQLTLVYLPKEADYLQRIDPLEPNKIVLIRGHTGQKITIFDFEGMTHRY